MAEASGDVEFSIKDKVFITSHAIVYESCTKACQIFKERFKREPPPRTTVQHWKKKFEETGNLSTKPRSGRPSDEHMKESVVQYVKENDTANQRRVARFLGTSQSSVHRYLKQEKVKPFKFSFQQELTEDDPDRRIEFCSWIINENGTNFCRRIIFSDEASFYLNGHVRKHNLFYYSEENEHRLIRVPMKSPGLTVWAAVSYDLGITFSIIRETMNQVRYVDVLNQKLLPFVGDNTQHWYQHDGAPPHFSIAARTWLDEHFPQRWIGRRGPQEWPPRSPDLTIPDFWLWSYVKDRVYAIENNFLNLDELQGAISRVLSDIDHRIIRKCYTNFVERCNLCLQQNGEHFEQLL